MAGTATPEAEMDATAEAAVASFAEAAASFAEAAASSAEAEAATLWCSEADDQRTPSCIEPSSGLVCSVSGQTSSCPRSCGGNGQHPPSPPCLPAYHELPADGR